MEIPRELNIASIPWKVERSESVAREGNVYGSTHFRTQTIYLDPTNTPERDEQTFLHELIHIAFDLSGLNAREPFGERKTQELVTDALANSLYHILKENNLLA